MTSFAFAGTIQTRSAIRTRVQLSYGIDTPAPGATVSGVVEVRGYVNEAGVSRVTLLVDDTPMHDADLNQPRSDPRWTYPSFEGEPFVVNPGFATSFLTAFLSDGEHTVAVRVTFSDGHTEVIGERTVTVDNSVNQGPVGTLDSPRDPNQVGMQDYLSGVYPVTGWALDPDGIRQRNSPAGCVLGIDAGCHILADIEVMVDGTVVGQSIFGLPRPDAAIAYPDLPGALDSGYQMNLDTTRYSNGPHTVSVRAWDDKGASSVIGSRSVWIDNNYATEKPFGHIDFPMPNAHLFSTACQGGLPSGIEYEDLHRIEWVSGWAIDQNSQQRFEGIKYVELLLDGVLLKSTATDCDYLSQFLMDVNCYGMYERPDILYRYPQFPADAKYSGFFFALDMDYIIGQLGIHKGLHYLAIRVGTQDPNRPAVIIDQIPVIVDCPEIPDFPAFGDLEVPELMQDMTGVELLKGWVIDYEQVITLNVWVDGVLDGRLVAPSAHLNTSRPDLVARYPFYPYIFLQNAGFDYSLDTSKYVDGVHMIVLETIDRSGYHTFWVQRPVRFNNAN